MKAIRIVPAVVALALLSGATRVADISAIAQAPEKADPLAAIPTERSTDEKASQPKAVMPGLLGTISDAEGAPPPKALPADSKPGTLGACTFAEGLDLLKRKEAMLEERERKLAEREALLAVNEVRVGHEISRLARLKEQLERLVGTAKAAPLEDAKRMASIYAAMKPQKAGPILDTMHPELAAEILDLMVESRATGILAAMEPTKARDVTRYVLERRKPTPYR